MNLYDPRVYAAIAETAVPPGRGLFGGDAATVARLQAGLADIHPALAPGWRALAMFVDGWALATTRHHFASLPLGRRLAILESLDRRESTRNLLRGLLAPLKLAAFEDPRQHTRLGCEYGHGTPTANEPARWREGVVDGATLLDETLECDVVVVGTGAGGAPLAARLAEAGFGVCLLEEGAHHTRTDFTGRPVDMMRRLYRNGGATVALGNTVIPIPVGRGVGGTTLINSGTCFRVPTNTLAEWRESSGITGLTAEALDPYYSAVERDLEIAPSSPAAIGRIGDIVARGCDALGWAHHPLARNAPGCDGQGVCVFGCPTDAKRSTNVSYVPRALSAGAMLVTGAKVESVVTENGRAVGVRARVGEREVQVRARAVVLACGALGTPALLLRQGLANTSGEVGRNLSIHPATASMGLFDERVDGFRSVPQGYGINEFHDEGLLFEGSSLPLELTAAMTPGFGPAWTALMEQAQHTMLFGFLVKDTSRGRVSATRSGEPRITYWLNRKDTARVQRGLGLLARLYLAAGAREVRQPAMGHERLHTLADVARFENASMAARHFDLTAYHPAGTCRMGADAARSVVDANHLCHDVPGLYVVDASALPGSPGVNPQLSIMALSLRAADAVGAALG
ncbi:hypothetical protein LBMAG42_26110 [Deltaproteobacteria bacterium]|nr:hypothetical protein LBMAG42_26110 [Deltaproteobacteria bacterium]